MPKNDLEKLIATVLSDRDARVAAKENDLRRGLAESFEVARQRKGFSIRRLAREIRTSISQVQRLLHREVGGTVTLRSVCKAADLLELEVRLTAMPTPRLVSVEYANSAIWTDCTRETGEAIQTLHVQFRRPGPPSMLASGAWERGCDLDDGRREEKICEARAS